MKRYGGLTRTFAKKMAMGDVGWEIYTLPADCRNCISDIFDGATKGKCKDGYKHQVKYWKDPNKMPAEAFAHYLEAMAVNPNNYQKMKEWLPESTKVFEEMLQEISK